MPYCAGAAPVAHEKRDCAQTSLEPPSVGHGLGDERHVVRGVDEEEAHDDHEQHDRDLDDGEDRAHASGELRAGDEQDGEDRDDQERRPAHLQSGDVDGRGERDADGEERLAEVDAPVLRDHRGAREHLEDEVPADDPREELAHGRVREGVGAAGHRHGGRELGVAHDREPARERGEDERDGHAGPGEVGRRLRADREDARADRDRDAHQGEVPRAERPLQAAFLVDRVGDRRLDGFHPQVHESPKPLRAAPAAPRRLSVRRASPSRHPSANR